MGLYLPGADIHDFLACLGKHAVEKVSFGFSDLKTVEPECDNIVFVEDTDEFTHCADGFGLANKEKEAAPGGWGESLQKEDNSGWDAEPNTEAKNDAMPSNTGWATAETGPLEGGGWGYEQVADKDNGWGSMEKNEVDKAGSVSHEGGWGSKQEVACDNGWDALAKSDVNTTAQTDNWDSMEGQNLTNGTSKGSFMHPSRRSMNAADSTESPHASERHSGNFEPSGTNMVPLGRRKRFVKADVNTGLTNDDQCEEKDHMGWGAGAPSAAGDDSGWGGSNQEEDKTPVQQGLGQDDWASGMGWETSRSEPASQNLMLDSLDKDALQTVPESEMLGMNGWANENDWTCKGNSETYETPPLNPPGSWDAMEGQNARKRSKGLAGITDRTEKESADERRSGKFAPSGSNTIPLGKRRTVMKPNVSSNEPESFMMKSTQPSEGKEDQTGWANCEPTTAAEDFGWDNRNPEEKEKCEKSSSKGLDIDGRASDAKWGKESAGQTNQGWLNDSIGKGNGRSQFTGEASADLHGWGSEMPTVKNVQDDGWDDIKLDAPSVPCSNNHPKPSPSSCNSAGFKWSAEQDGTSRPTKKFNRGSSNNSWTGFASKSPQFQSRRPRLRYLMNTPEYSELDELYKATNKILHHNEYQLGDKLNTEDEKFILEKILVHHQDKEAKVGCGVDYVMIDAHAEHQVNCFWLVRKDGTKTDFSYWKCLEGLYETKYSQGASMKDGTNDGWNSGTNSKASTKSDQEGAKGSWRIGGSYVTSRKGIWDKEKTKSSWDVGVSSAGQSESAFDEEETKGSWDMRASSELPIKRNCQGEAKDNWDIGASSAAPTKKSCDQGDGWDMWAGSAASTKKSCDQGDGWDTWAGSAALTKSKCDKKEERDSRDMGANSAENICDQATRKDVPEEVSTKDGWGGF